MKPARALILTLVLPFSVGLSAWQPVLAGLDVSGTYTFTGRDLQSTIVIKRLKDGRFSFSAEATNDRLLHDGSYEGEFELEGNVAHFREQTDHDGCDLRFDFRGDKLIVNQDPDYGNCDCGAGVSFDGTYQRLQHPSKDHARQPAKTPVIPIEDARPTPR